MNLLKLKRVFALIFTVLLSASQSASVWAASKTMPDFKQIEEKMSGLQQIIDEYYLYEEDPESMAENIYAGMLNGLGDPYSVYYSAEEFDQILQMNEGQYCGIGIITRQDLNTGIISILSIMPDSPAEKAGVQAGDYLYKVEDQEVTGMELGLMSSNYIKGEEGTKITITTYRYEENKYYNFTMERAFIEVPTVEYKMLENQVSYVKVSEFDAVTAKQFQTAIETLESQGMKKLVIDLRDNLGGLLDSVVEMSAYILPEGKIVSIADKNENGFTYLSKDGYLVEEINGGIQNGRLKKLYADQHELKIPMAVLVNGESASASEVFTGALKDYKWATIVGTTTFGKGIVQSLIPLDDGSAIKLTVSRYYTPSGYDLHGKGIEPNVIVELNQGISLYTEDLKNDNQLKAALDALAKQ